MRRERIERWERGDRMHEKKRGRMGDGREGDEDKKVGEKETSEQSCLPEI